MAMSIKSRFSKKYIIFIAIFPLLTVTSLVNAECPVCEGGGIVSSAPGMENVEIIDVKSKEDYERFEMVMMRRDEIVALPYEVTLTVVNKGSDDTEGYVEMVLFWQGELIDNEYFTLEIPGETSLDVTYTIWFESQEYLFALVTEVEAAIVIDDVPDVTCNGTGQIPLNTWLPINGFKDRLRELGRPHYAPPLQMLKHELVNENEKV